MLGLSEKYRVKTETKNAKNYKISPPLNSSIMLICIYIYSIFLHF